MNKGKSILLIIGLLLALAIATILKFKHRSPGILEAGTSSVIAPANFSLDVYELDDGWGYKIYLDSALFIYQETIPSITGGQKFASYNDAYKCGELVVKRLKANQRFSIGRAELDSLNISY